MLRSGPASPRRRGAVQPPRRTGSPRLLRGRNRPAYRAPLCKGRREGLTGSEFTSPVPPTRREELSLFPSIVQLLQSRTSADSARWASRFDPPVLAGRLRPSPGFRLYALLSLAPTVRRRERPVRLALTFGVIVRRTTSRAARSPRRAAAHEPWCCHHRLSGGHLDAKNVAPR